MAKSGHWVVLPAASSSVALAANALARHLGAKTVGVTRTRSKVQALEAVEYDAVVVAEDGDVAQQVRDVTQGGADLLFDPVGGAQFGELATAMKPGSNMVIYGVLDEGGTRVPIFPMMASRATLTCYTVFDLVSDPVKLREAVAYYLPLFEAGVLAPAVDPQAFCLDQIADAFRHMESNLQIGKVVVSV